MDISTVLMDIFTGYKSCIYFYINIIPNYLYLYFMILIASDCFIEIQNSGHGK